MNLVDKPVRVADIGRCTAIIACLLFLNACAPGTRRLSAQRPLSRSAVPQTADRPRDVGRARSGALSILLKLRDPRATRLPADVAAIYDPRSSRYGQFIRPGRFHQRYGPEPSLLRAVRGYLTRRGIHVSPATEGSWITVSGPVGVVDRLFHADVHRYRTTSGQTYVASNRDSTVPKPLRRLVVSAGRVSTVFIHTEAIPGGGFSPTGIMDAYDIRPLQRLGIDGAGQTIVFVEVDGVDESALSAYSQRFHLPPLNYTTYGPQLKPGPEATMDLEVVHAIAPRARLVVYNLPFADIFADLHRQLSQLIARSAGDIFSESLAICERSDTKQNAQALQSAYAQADAAGEAVFAATGDDAAFGCITQSNTAPVSSAVSAMIPAACPGVTAVGGTRLSVRGDGAWYDETVWEDPLQTEGTGGGPTRLYGRPSWQRAPGVSQQDSTYNTAGYRLLPDVSADADPASGMAIDIPQTGWTDGGGTSQATPIWAAITALIDQYLEQQHHHSLGWLNPALYSLARTPQAYPPFHDVTVGTNLVYPATKGYDMATGLGTPDAWFLAQDLAFYQKSHGR